MRRLRTFIGDSWTLGLRIAFTHLFGRTGEGQKPDTVLDPVTKAWFEIMKMAGHIPFEVRVAAARERARLEAVHLALSLALEMAQADLDRTAAARELLVRLGAFDEAATIAIPGSDVLELATAAFMEAVYSGSTSDVQAYMPKVPRLIRTGGQPTRHDLHRTR